MRSNWIIVVCAWALVLAPAARSEIVYTDIPDVFLSAGASVDLDIDQDGTPDIQLWSGSGGSWATAAPGVDILTVEVQYAASVPAGGLIGVADQTWAPYAAIAVPCEFIPYCSFLPLGGQPGFLGVRLSGDDGARFGWIRASWFWDQYGATLTIYDFAYEQSPETPIAAGDISCLEDCNQNGRCDLSDILFGASFDLNTNFLPDECEPVVTVRVPNDYPTINEAVAALPANASTILVAPGMYDVMELDLGARPLTIRGDGPRGSVVVVGSYLVAYGAARLENLGFENMTIGAEFAPGILILGCDALNSVVRLGNDGRMDRCRLIALASATQTVLHVASAVVSNTEIVRLGSFPYAPVFANGTRFVNCTIAQAGSSAPAINSPWVYIVVENSIIRTDGPTALEAVAVVRYSDVSGGWAGEGNIDADPRFVRNPGTGPDSLWGTADDDFGDLRLRAGSPCIDAGDNAALPLDDLDLDGDGNTTEAIPFDLAGLARVVRGLPGPGPVVDMGAYERQMWRRPMLQATAVERP